VNRGGPKERIVEADDNIATRRREFLTRPIEPDPVIEAFKKDVDRTLLIENLRLTVPQRLDRHERAARLVPEVRRAGEEGRRRSDESRSTCGGTA
jgi:hypothetical protein